MENNVFTKWMFEADEDPPDIEDNASMNNDNQEPPDISQDDGTEEPPDIDGDIVSDEGFDTQQFDDFDDGSGNEDGTIDDTGEENNTENLNLPEKISAIMNNQLYQRYLGMINSIGTQIQQMKNNGDILFSLLGDEYSKLLDRLEKLDENVKLWMKNNFINEDFSKNLLFFNMCLNLLNLLNDSFDEKVKKGTKEKSAE